MKFSKSKIAVAFGSALGLGMAGQASADVYGVSYLNVDNLLITTNSVPGAGLYTFNTNQDAILNGNPDPSSGAANCVGTFLVFSTCNAGVPTLSGNVQNAPPNAAATSRGAGDYTVFGQNGNYSNSEAEILEAALTLDPKTHVTSISESNLATTGTAQANTNTGSNTNLNLVFGGVPGSLTVSFTADINLQTEASGLGGGEKGIAQAASGATFLLQLDGVTLASWAPDGSTGGITTCGAGLTCAQTTLPGGPSLNNTSASNGANNSVIGSGSYSLTVTGLGDSTVGNPYSVAFNTTTSTNLTRVPVPGTALLIGTGLLLGARATRRKKK